VVAPGSGYTLTAGGCADAAAAAARADFGDAYWSLANLKTYRFPKEDLGQMRTALAAAATGFLAGMAMFGAISFVPLFLQSVSGMSATAAGIVLIPFVLGWVAMSITSARAGRPTRARFSISLRRYQGPPKGASGRLRRLAVCHTGSSTA